MPTNPTVRQQPLRRYVHILVENVAGVRVGCCSGALNDTALPTPVLNGVAIANQLLLCGIRIKPVVVEYKNEYLDIARNYGYIVEQDPQQIFHNDFPSVLRTALSLAVPLY